MAVSRSPLALCHIANCRLPPTAMSVPSKSRDRLSRDSYEEREGLLDESDKFESFDNHFDKDGLADTDDDPDSWPRSKIVKTASAFIILLVLGAFARALLRSGPSSLHPNLSFHGDYLRSNGTHDFKRTVLIVSIDGLR